jgi:hypothetical protein
MSRSQRLRPIGSPLNPIECEKKGRKHLKNRQLPVFLLFLPLVVETQHRFVEHSGKGERLVNFFRLGDSAEFRMQRNGNFGFEEFFLLREGWHNSFVISKLNPNVK